MENKIDIATILKDCPKGMELDCTMFDDVTFVRVDNSKEQFPIEIAVGGLRSKYLTKEGCFHDTILYPEAKCVIFPKGKTTWEGFQGPFKDGDVVAYDDEEGDTQLFIYKEKIEEEGDGYALCYLTLRSCGQLDLSEGEYSFQRFATEEEKQKFFDAIKENGYCWNAETKTLEKIKERKFDIKTCLNCKTFKDMHQNCPYSPIWRYKDLNEAKSHLRDETDCQFWNEIPKTKTLEKLVKPKFKVGDRIKNSNNHHSSIVAEIKDDCFIIKTLDGLHHSYLTDKLPFSKQDEYELVTDKFNINTLKPYDRVLVRGDVEQRWTIDFFGFMDNNKGCPFVCVGHYVTQCIPYEGNEHLLGKEDDCDEFYKTWE